MNSTDISNASGLRVAVVGGGVAGIVSAWLLQRRHEVTIFEANGHLGGHTHTFVIEGGPDEGTPVDTGFIVMNDRTYPLFGRFLDQLGVDTRPTTMSFSFTDEASGLTYSGSGPDGLFAQRSNLLRPSFLRMLLGIRRFWSDANRDLARGSVPSVSLEDYIAGRYPAEAVNDYIIPMASAIWSSPPGEIGRFPAESFLRFFHNHGLLGVRNLPQWMTVKGGSHSYVKAFQSSFRGRILLNCPVRGLSRREGGVLLRTTGGSPHRFDKAVMAAHADDALALLEDPSDEERLLLGAWRYHDNDTILHTDTSALPPEKRAWACWNYCREKAGADSRPVSVTYSMNLLQGLGTVNHYCVSLNRQAPVRPDSVVARMVYRHPAYSFGSVDTQKSLHLLNGVKNTFYCGSYFGYGFHEDAVRSAVEVGRLFGIPL